MFFRMRRSQTFRSGVCFQCLRRTFRFYQLKKWQLFHSAPCLTRNVLPHAEGSNPDESTVKHYQVQKQARETTRPENCRSDSTSSSPSNRDRGLGSSHQLKEEPPQQPVSILGRPNQKPIRSRAWKALLRSKSLGEPTSVLVVRDAEGGQSSRGAQEHTSEHALQEVRSTDLIASIHESKNAPGQSDVNAAIDELKPTSNARGPDGSLAVSRKDFSSLMSTLDDKFNQLQLSRYVTIGVGTQAMQAKTDDQSRKVGRKEQKKNLTKLDKKKLSNEVYTRDVRPWTPVDSEGLLLRRKSVHQESFSGKKAVIDNLLRKVWRVEVIEETQHPGIMALGLELQRLFLLSDDRSQKSPLRQISQQHNVSISLDIPKHLVVIGGTKSGCIAASNSIRKRLSNYVDIKLPLQLLMAPTEGGKGFNGRLKIEDAYRLAGRFECRLSADSKNNEEIKTRAKKTFNTKKNCYVWTLHSFDYEKAMACIRAIVQAAKGRFGEWAFLINEETASDNTLTHKLVLAGPPPQVSDEMSSNASRFVAPFRIARGDTPTMLKVDYNLLNKDGVEKSLGYLDEGFDPRSVLEPEMVDGRNTYTASIGQIRWNAQLSPRSVPTNEQGVRMLHERSRGAEFDARTPGLSHLLNHVPDLAQRTPIFNESELRVTLINHPLSMQTINDDQLPPLVHLSFQPHPRERLLTHKDTRILLASPVTNAVNILCPGLATDVHLTHERSIRFVLPKSREKGKMGRELDNFIKAIETNAAGYGRVTAPPDAVIFAPYWRKASKPISMEEHPTRYAGMKMFDRRMFTRSIEFVQEIKWTLPELSGRASSQEEGPQLVYTRISGGEESGVRANERLEVRYVVPFAQDKLSENQSLEFLASINGVLKGLNKGLGKMDMKNVDLRDGADGEGETQENDLLNASAAVDGRAQAAAS